jgi:pilus assembly protein Flp/PilA
MNDLMLQAWVGAQARFDELMAKLRRGDEGQTMVEYALLLVLIAIVVILMVTLVGDRANIIFNRIAANLNKA